MRISDWSSDVCSSDLSSLHPIKEELHMMKSAINVSQVERWTSALGGAALTAVGLKRRTVGGAALAAGGGALIARGLTGYCRSEEHTSELQSLMRNSYAVFCLKKTKNTRSNTTH